MTHNPISDAETFWFEIDVDNRIVRVSPNWDRFALENDAPKACAEHVLNRPLMDFIAGLDPQHLYPLLLKRARATRAPVRVPFRCDRPSVRRFMEMRILSDANGHVEFQNVILREERRESVGLLDCTSVDGARGSWRMASGWKWKRRSGGCVCSTNGYCPG